jgi:hypothetical protein
MRKVFLIVGFNNWGKTTLLKDLFGVKAFRKGRPYLYAGCPFLVLPNSNDDVGMRGYMRHYHDRLKEFRKAHRNVRYIASAFCPTREPRNDSLAILRTLYGADQVEMLLLKYKWCGHAKLLISEVEQFYSNEPNVTVHRVTSKTPTGKLSSAQAIFSNCLP